MTRVRFVLLGSVLTALLASAVGMAYLRVTGLTARGEPAGWEARIARALRTSAIPGEARGRPNPEPATAETIAEGLAHYADHCAVCHGADGSGRTQVGQGTWPKAPDMRLPATQELSDGELFYIIEEGVRFTGMPGWSTGTPEGARSSWHLVHFIRHLPVMTAEEIVRMESLMPRSPEDIRQEIEAERFLEGGDPPPPAHAH
jgi:mono/diheme cytochrome c family protein